MRKHFAWRQSVSSEVCNGCRMCFKFCDSFPDLFKFLDDDYDGDVTKITEPQVDTVVDSCFQCKLCEVQCPYTPRDNHEFQLDFPKLMHRHRAIRRAQERLHLSRKSSWRPESSWRARTLKFRPRQRHESCQCASVVPRKAGWYPPRKTSPDFAATTSRNGHMPTAA